MLKALLFDLDGTLTHSDPVHFETWAELLKGYGLTINLDFYKVHFNGRLNEHIIQDLLPQLSVDEGIQLSRYKEAEFRRRAATVLHPLAGLDVLLPWMNQRALKRAVVTNAPRDNAYFILQTLNFDEIFPVVILGEELERGKPDPLPYTFALDGLDIAPKEAIVFEDSPSGVQAAVAAGIPTVGIASSQPPEILYQAGATLVVSDFSDRRLFEQLLEPTEPLLSV
ncbi:MAG: HAD-IA family hydrolase [Synechococcales cyanobacterium K44_A2020_017]|nr:HAD-IA family hydrolase [Synechococcales cyanobacterium K32_A2020_035]MBF2094036.1 HAD-IA family hydrolase [Synechococcales cyanobacterium K44_A2020_017]